MMGNPYAGLLLQLRLMADEAGDGRSLVAITAQFERDAKEVLAALTTSLVRKGHNRNQGS